MQNLQKEFTAKGVIWLAVCSSAEGKQGNFTKEELAKKQKDYKTAETAYLIDESGKVGKMYNAKVTPDMAVINPDQEVIYLGAIDNMPSTDKADIDKADNYVMQALNSAMNGKKVEVKSLLILMIFFSYSNPLFIINYCFIRFWRAILIFVEYQ
jgi:hypothetical protein